MLRTLLFIVTAALFVLPANAQPDQSGGRKHGKKKGGDDKSQTQPSADNPLPAGSIWTGQEASLLRDGNAPQKVKVKVSKSDGRNVTLRVTRDDNSIWDISATRDGSKLTITDITVVKHKHRGAATMRETSGSGTADGKSLKFEFESHFFSGHTKNQPVHSAVQATPEK